MSDFFSSTVAEIDLAALAHNYTSLRQFMPGSVKMLAVVKADAYGHGAVPVSRKLEELGVAFFGVATVREGVEIREGGVTTPTLVLSGVYPQDITAVLTFRLTPVVFRRDTVELLSAEAAKRKMDVPVHLKIDTGMGRIGVPYEEVPTFLDVLNKCPNIVLEGVASHFSTADEEGSPHTQEQLRRFAWVIDQIEKTGGRPVFYHMANSAAIFTLPAAHLNLVRPGIMLYGAYPSESFESKVTLKPVMSWKSRVADLKSVPAGAPVSYGRTYYTKNPSRIAAIPVGYADGYSRHLSNKGSVLIRGRRAPVVGTVCMDWIMVDATEIPDVEVGDEVTLMGYQGDAHITAAELAKNAGTISYEILCSVGKRVSRVYKD